ncbi:Glucose oxidase [Verticillium dahliae VDG2]|nr:Glucose oxidase [Verticillium dahliae VDG2]
MSSSSQPEEIHLETPDVEFADMELLSTLGTIDLDSLLFTPTMATIFLPDGLQTVSPFSLGSYDMDARGAVSTGETAFQSLAYQDSTSHQQATTPVITELHSLVQQLAAQIQSLSTRVQYLEASHQQSSEAVGYTSLRLDHLATSVQRANSAVEDFTVWSKNIDKHFRDQQRNLLDLIGMVQKADSGAGDDESLSSVATPTT